MITSAVNILKVFAVKEGAAYRDTGQPHFIF